MTATRTTLAISRCVCGACFDQSDWASLAIVDRVEASEVQGFVADWPDGNCIEIRRCGRCALGILAKVAQVVHEDGSTLPLSSSP